MLYTWVTPLVPHWRNLDKHPTTESYLYPFHTCKQCVLITLNSNFPFLNSPNLLPSPCSLMSKVTHWVQLVLFTWSAYLGFHSKEYRLSLNCQLLFGWCGSLCAPFDPWCLTAYHYFHFWFWNMIMLTLSPAWNHDRSWTGLPLFTASRVAQTMCLATMSD